MDMEIRRLPTDEATIRRYVADLWLPYVRELEAVVETFALADDVDLVAEQVAFERDRLGKTGCQAWIAVDGLDGRTERALADGAGELIGHVVTEIDACPAVFDRPDRLVIGDVYVRETHRGTGLARALIDRAWTARRDHGGEAPDRGPGRDREVELELELEVDVDNDRAIAFYEKLGFRPARYTMRTETIGGQSRD